MRRTQWTAFFLFAASGLCLAAPQDNAPAPNTNVAPNLSQHSKDLKKPVWTQMQTYTYRLTAPTMKQYGCFHIHAFNFEKNGGESPKLKSETTCTPNTVRLLPATPQTTEEPQK